MEDWFSPGYIMDKVALQACWEILDWLQAHSVFVAREDTAGFYE